MYEDKKADASYDGIDMTLTKGADGIYVVWVDTPAHLESSKGPMVRVYLNDDPVYGSGPATASIMTDASPGIALAAIQELERWGIGYDAQYNTRDGEERGNVRIYAHPTMDITIVEGGLVDSVLWAQYESVGTYVLDIDLEKDTPVSVSVYARD